MQFVFGKAIEQKTKQNKNTPQVLAKDWKDIHDLSVFEEIVIVDDFFLVLMFSYVHYYN